MPDNSKDVIFPSPGDLLRKISIRFGTGLPDNEVKQACENLPMGAALRVVNVTTEQITVVFPDGQKLALPNSALYTAHVVIAKRAT